MDVYKKMYDTLFDGITEAISVLWQAQMDTEEIFISKGEEEKNCLKSEEEKYKE